MAGTNTLDYSTLTVTDTAQVLAETSSPVMPTRAKGAIITGEVNQWRWRDDGTAPTSSEGHLMNPGDILTFDSWTVPSQNWVSVLKAIQVIEVTGAPLLKISWYD